MFPPFPEEVARQYCFKLMEQLDSCKSLCFGSLCPEDKLGTETIPSPNPDFSTDYLFGKAKGQMFGILVCLDSEGNQIVLKAFSGQYNGHYIIPGWIPPLLDTKEYNKQVEKDDGAIKKLTAKIEQLHSNGENEQTKTMIQLKEKRKTLSQKSYEAICNLYSIPCADGKHRNLKEIIPDFAKGLILPFTGTGDCCAPKLLGYAFDKGFRPISLAEFYYGKANNSNTKQHKNFYSPCNQKCAFILPQMLGIEILYRDESIIVVNKPAGLLSVPGRGYDMQDCVVNRVKKLFPQCINQPSVHRLDMDTSGLLVLAFTEKAHKALSKQFMEGTVYKEYHALLLGKPCGAAAFDKNGVEVKEGIIKLPFRLDIENRPKQIYDSVNGKEGITEWQTLEENINIPEESKKCTKILFRPKTGRTHQLRLHSMHNLGLGAPIVGDRLYGTRRQNQRLMLHASKIIFFHPESGDRIEFFSIPPF